MKLKHIYESYPDSEFLKMDGYDDCVEGVVERFGQEPILCYNYNKVIKKLIKHGMSEEEAVEFFEFNQIGAWVGDSTPCFIKK
jgi:biotin synthase-related radical SAM superfamily protein